MKKLQFCFHRVFGRSHGKLTSSHRGGGHKRLFRYIDLSRFLFGVKGKILKIEKNPYSNANLALVGYSNGILSYILAYEGASRGDIVDSSFRLKEKFNLGDCCPLRVIDEGTYVHNIKLHSMKGGQLVKSAGTGALVIKKYVNSCLVKLPSGAYNLLPLDNLCSIGFVGNNRYKFKNLQKAGANRWRGRRPHVRGQAMNPVDHPHGGRTNGGKVPVTPWGRIAKGVKTSRSKKKSF